VIETLRANAAPQSFTRTALPQQGNMSQK